MEQVAQSYFNDLINRSMILPMIIAYDGSVLYCQVHDMVLNILISMSTEDNFVTRIDVHMINTLPKRIRRLSIHYNNSEEAVMPTTITKPSYMGLLRKYPTL